MMDMQSSMVGSRIFLLHQSLGVLSLTLMIRRLVLIDNKSPTIDARFASESIILQFYQVSFIK